MATLNVPLSYATIQDAIDAAAAGDIIAIGSTYVGPLTAVVSLENLRFDVNNSLTGIELTLDVGILNARLGSLSTSNVTIIGNDSGNIIVGNAGNNILYGEGGWDTLVGGAGADELYGGTGLDVLRGGTGDDILNGGQGFTTDLADYRDASGPVSVQLTDAVTAGGPTGGFSSGADGNDTLIAIDHIRGSAWDDVLTGNSGSNILRGGLGADTLDGGDGHDFADYKNSTISITASLDNPSGQSGEAFAPPLFYPSQPNLRRHSRESGNPAVPQHGNWSCGTAGFPLSRE